MTDLKAKARELCREMLAVHETLGDKCDCSRIVALVEAAYNAGKIEAYEKAIEYAGNDAAGARRDLERTGKEVYHEPECLREKSKPPLYAALGKTRDEKNCKES